jgi:ribosome biogenesis GTPase A
MSRTLNKLPVILRDIDMVIEARDARLPLTSVNPALEEALEQSWGKLGTGSTKGKEKVVVYTKRDQAEERFEAVSTSLLETCLLLSDNIVSRSL